MEILLYCNCTRANLTPEPARIAALGILGSMNAEFLYTDDLCGLCADEEACSGLASSLKGNDVIIAACYPRAVKALLSRAGCDAARIREVINLRVAEPADIIARIRNMKPSAGSRRTLPAGGVQEPWYPLIDSDRCVQCRQCMNFCLFGVYAPDTGGNVSVAEPYKCKNGCPACARICPNAAIIFPKYGMSPVNGDIVNEADWKHAHIPADPQRLARGGIMRALRERGGADPAAALEKLKHDLDIPDKVIEGLE